MKNLNKLISSIIILSAICILPHFAIAEFSFGDEFPYEWVEITPWVVDTNFTGIIKNSINEQENWLKKLLKLFMPEYTMYMQDENDNPSFLFYLKTIVNLLLSFVSLIALILVVYAFYMMFFKKDETGWNTAKQILKWVIIALFVIWLSRIIVSFLYRIEKENTQGAEYEIIVQSETNKAITYNTTKNI